MPNVVRAWFDKVFKKTQKTQLSHNLSDILSGIAPLYSSGFGNDIYASDVVQHAIYSIVTELKKLDPVHVRKMVAESEFVEVAGSIQRVLENPNPLMTTSDFIEKVAWTLLLNYNAFIYPLWEGNNLKALYPLQPTLVEFDADYLGSGQTWVRFHFANGYKGDVPYENIIHLRHKYSASEFMGGNINGNPDFAPLLETLKLNDTLLKGLAKSLKMQTAINFVAKLKSMVNYDDQLAKVAEFEKKIAALESGILPVDISAEIVPIQKQIQLLDATTLEFIDKKIFRWFGVSIAIVNGDYTAAQYEAFYQKTLEPMVKSWGQAFTKGLFSKRQVEGFKNKIVFFTKELVFMNTDQKIKLFDILVDSAACYSNELRTAFGLRPLKALEGVIATSSNKNNAMNNAQDNDGNKGLASGQNSNEDGGVNNGE